MAQGGLAVKSINSCYVTRQMTSVDFSARKKLPGSADYFIGEPSRSLNCCDA
jgi:hypothetical protein